MKGVGGFCMKQSTGCGFLTQLGAESGFPYIVVRPLKWAVKVLRQRWNERYPSETLWGGAHFTADAKHLQLILAAARRYVAHYFTKTHTQIEDKAGGESNGRLLLSCFSKSLIFWQWHYSVSDQEESAFTSLSDLGHFSNVQGSNRSLSVIL